jgi:hypothetical protein
MSEHKRKLGLNAQTYGKDLYRGAQAEARGAAAPRRYSVVAARQ